MQKSLWYTLYIAAMHDLLTIELRRLNLTSGYLATEGLGFGTCVGHKEYQRHHDDMSITEKLHE